MPSPLEAGAQRFSGFAGLYDDVRPSPPPELGELLASYAGGRPDLVVDLGCGTGLSSRWAATWAGEVIGIEPSDDMRTTAEGAPTAGVTFRAGWSHDTGLPDACADVVLAVQALHWMEPGPTFAEVHRLLRPGGVFAAIDCDWPPVLGDAVVEEAWDDCRRRMRVFETRLGAGVTGDELLRPVAPDDPAATSYSGVDAHREERALVDGVRGWSKLQHLANMEASGRFRWCREVALTSSTTGDAARIVGLLRSHGDYQTVIRHGLDDAVLGVDRFAEVAAARMGPRPVPWRLVYRVRLGVTA